MKRIILSLLFNVCVICPAFCVSSIQTACMQLGFEDCGNVPCSLPICIKHEGVSNVSPSCAINIDCKCVQKCTYTCEPGYYGGGSSLSGCTRCPEHATCPGASAVDRTATFTCDDGYKKNALGNGCESETVTQCPDGSYLHTYNGATACAPCPGNATCVNDILTCDAGYYKYTGPQSRFSAYFCCLNNATCDDTGNFSHCNTGYYGDATNGCTKCPTNATECDGAGAATKCASGYLLHNGACLECTGGATCTGDDTMTCTDGYICEINDDDNVVECYNCPDGADCVDCKFQSCKSGYYGSDETNCKICPANAICSTTAITSCVDGYILESGACNKCLDGEVCTNGAFVRCAEGYYGSGRGNCKVCPANGDCTGGIFNGCKSEYYGNLDAGCRACPVNATCDGGATFKCDANYFKYTNETESGCEPCGISRVCSNEGECLYCKSGYYGVCEDGCTKCPTLDKRPGTSDATKALDGTYSNTSIKSCYVTVKDEDNVGNVSDLKGRLNDGIGTYYFSEETCYATDINK